MQRKLGCSCTYIFQDQGKGLGINRLVEHAKAILGKSLIQVGDASLRSMVQSRLIEQDGEIGVRFEFRTKEYSVTFGNAGPPSGHISISDRGRILVDQELSRIVTPQRGMLLPDR